MSNDQQPYAPANPEPNAYTAPEPSGAPNAYTQPVQPAGDYEQPQANAYEQPAPNQQYAPQPGDARPSAYAAQPGYTQQSYGQQYGQPQYAQPQYGQPANPYTQPQYSSPNPQYATPQYNAPQYGAGHSSKSKLAAGLLGIFLGAFGVHNFYLGNTGKAVAQLLLTCVGWILIGLGPLAATIWGLVEGILILTSRYGSPWHQDANGQELTD
ncbi:TM2 domain-containing protein [Bifidobacterium cebidarum]|uniref:TM2 domain-containing protein n=2 Tax=Bifidobacterium cebidarum TaxID=2650773 RepID=A0A6I1GAI9_9BIFI|nr:TM2 domain-containing protein [Bifidobacterium cebidarum]